MVHIIRCFCVHIYRLHFTFSRSVDALLRIYNDITHLEFWLFYVYQVAFVFLPRTKTIKWQYVVSNFAQVLACLFYTYYIFERFCVPVFQNFNRESVTPRALLLSVFGSMMPATLVLFIGELFHFVKKKVRCTFLNRFAYLLGCFSYHTEPDSLVIFPFVITIVNALWICSF